MDVKATRGPAGRRCGGRLTHTRRVLRGGAFNNDENNVRCADRNRNDPDNRNRNNGFRLVVVLTLFQWPELRRGATCAAEA